MKRTSLTLNVNYDGEGIKIQRQASCTVVEIMAIYAYITQNLAELLCETGMPTEAALSLLAKASKNAAVITDEEEDHP